MQLKNKISKKLGTFLLGLLLAIMGMWKLDSISPQSMTIAKAMVDSSTILSATATLTPTATLSSTIIAQRLSTITASADLTFSLAATKSAQRFIFVDQSRQMMHLFENGVSIRTIPVSTGAPTTHTTTISWRGKVGKYLGSGIVGDNFRADEIWFLFPDLYGTVLIHSVPYTKNGEIKVYDQLDALGNRAASHGCVRISPEDAQWLKKWNPVGVPMEISRWKIEFHENITHSTTR